MSEIGRSLPVRNWDRRTSGAEEYAGDLAFDGLLIGGILRSPLPHGRIKGINTQKASEIDGVYAVITAADLVAGAKYIHHGGKLADRPPLADNVVRFIGQEVAAVAALTEGQVTSALSSIDVEYRRRPPVFDLRTSLMTKRRLHERPTGTNVSTEIRKELGDQVAVDGLVTSSAAGSFHYPRVAHACMETHVTIARWSSHSSQLEIWTSTQAPWFVEKEVSAALGLEKGQVVCREVAVGGGFGAKSKICEHEVLASLLAIKTGRPIRIAFSREEEFAFTKSRHEMLVDVKVKADDGHRIVSIAGDVIVNNGAYNHSGPSVLAAGIKLLASAYTPLAVSVRGRLVDSTTLPGGQFRGYGSPQVGFALESTVDELAIKSGVDPLEFRKTNAIPSNYEALSGAKIGTSGMQACLERAADVIGWHRKKGRLPYGEGLGVAVAMHGSGVFAYDGSNRSSATVWADDAGRVGVQFASADAGTGQSTILTQVAAEELGVSTEDVVVEMMDGERTPEDMGAWSSRGTHMGAHAVRKAARTLGQRLKDVARDELPGDQTQTVQPELVGGRVVIGSLSMTIGDLVGQSPDACRGVLSVETEFVDTVMERPDSRSKTSNASSTYSFAAHAVHLRVDTVTGKITILDYVAVHDVGRPINPLLAEGQVRGAAAMGLGAALSEELVIERGRVVNSAFIHYRVPRAADLPRIRVEFVRNTEDELGPYGAKGVGEIGIIPPAAAVGNALRDAIGIRFSAPPFTHDKILASLSKRVTGSNQPIYRPVWRRPDRWWIAFMRKCYAVGLTNLLELIPRRRSGAEPCVHALEEPASIERAVAAAGVDAAFIGGGTDLNVRRREGLTAPRRLIALGKVSEMVGVDRTKTGLRIGAATSLQELALEIESTSPAIARAIDSIASPQVRNVATLGGNLLQDKRCWFYRSGFDCYKRGGGLRPCYAIEGDHRLHHAAIGGHRCQAVTPSDLAIVLTALDASVIVQNGHSTREVPIGELYVGPAETSVRPDEIVAAVDIPAEAIRRQVGFEKLQVTQGDFATLSAAVSAEVLSEGTWAEVRIVIGAIAPTPWRARRAEAHLRGSKVALSDIVSAVEDDIWRDAHPLRGNSWKVGAAPNVAGRAASDFLIRPHGRK